MRIYRLGIICALFGLIVPARAANAQTFDVIRQAYRLEAKGQYQDAARLRLSVAVAPAGPGDGVAIDNIAVAAADEFDSGNHCRAVQLWHSALKPRKQVLFDADNLAIHRAYRAAFRGYGVLFSGQVIPANAIFIENGSVDEVRSGLALGAQGRYTQATARINQALLEFPTFQWAVTNPWRLRGRYGSSARGG